MKRLILPFITVAALIFGVFMLGEKAIAQTGKDLVGTWKLVSITIEKDGKKTDYYGPNPQGQAMYDDNGRFSIMVSRSDLPKFASNNREAGTPEENKAIVQGSIAFFGTYVVDAAAKTVTIHVESCSFPNWNGIDQKRVFNISGDELNITNPTSSAGRGTNQQVWQRAK
jgi:hypothetical protein